MKVTTTKGAVYEVNDKAFTDFRTIRSYSAMIDKSRTEEDRLAGAVSLVRNIMGKQEDAFLDGLEVDGYVDPHDVFSELNNIMEQLKNGSAEIKK